MIKLTQLLKELGINKPSEFFKFKKGGEYVVTYDLGDEEIYHFPLKIISIDSGGCCIATHIGREDIDYNNPDDIDNYGFTLCKDEVIKVEPYAPNNNIYELSINNPNLTAKEVINYWVNNININQNYRDIKKKYCLEYSINSSVDSEDLIRMLPKIGLNQFYKDLKELHRRQQQSLRPNNLAELQTNKPSLFNRLKEDGYYLISWNNNGTIETEKIKVLGFDGDEEEYWVNIQILSNVKKWNKLLGFEGDLDQIPWIQLFPEDLINLKPSND